MLFNCVGSFRNDHAFAISNLILNGYSIDDYKSIPWSMLTVDKPIESIEIKNDYLNPYLNLFQIYKRYNNQEKMLKIIEKIILIKPNFPIMYHEKAIILQDLGKFDESLKAIKTVFK